MESEPGGCLLSDTWKFAEDLDQMVNGLGMSRHGQPSMEIENCKISNSK
jgi:hypothetical protein